MNLKKATPKIILNIVIIVFMLVWILPTLGLLITSFRPAQDVSKTGWWSVLSSPLKFTQFTVENYQKVLGQGGMAMAFRNSFLITIMGTLIPVAVAAFAAFGLSRLHFKGRSFFYGLIVSLLVVPLQMTFIPVLKLYNTLNLSGSFVGLWLVHTGYGLPFAVFMLHNFFQSLPQDLFEAAYIDGASVWTVFYKLALPLSVPAIASLIIFQFLWVWNDLLVALIYLGGFDRVAPLTVKLSSLVGSYGQNWHLLTSAAFVSMIVPLIIFFTLQRYFVRGILAGSVKG
ncbi:carbohydrate ABC transporter permease [Halothermothrix orenii]|uniref:Binding-protein-dependent transport systems inner membrane component n=1 Tax=Halothermothrix orenii (strain H 168 / OCM 544 / DSM 9562) TaxID=373903 RepID=B8CY33_HALOH|nr:carbohydrate ABC transporter permease [Halothermothrix orenii]ACL70202.1 binding-protein-dependent transport systems inner membrane component [Halothermothrix orenii H 168]